MLSNKVHKLFKVNKNQNRKKCNFNALVFKLRGIFNTNHIHLKISKQM